SGVDIQNNTFVDAGGRVVREDGSFGTTGGSIYGSYLRDSEIAHNRFETTGTRPGNNVYGIKGRQFRDSRLHHNTIDTNFAIELPFENDDGVEIDHNWLDGTVSVPKFAGGPPADDDGQPAFHLHHNYFTRAYSIEGARNDIVIESNVFDIDVNDDTGNLIASFGNNRSPEAEGPLTFRDNLVLNPGRGVFWSDVVYNNLTFTNNHIVADETTPSEFPIGLFGFRVANLVDEGQETDFETITIADNIIEILGSGRDLLRNDESAGANISNNELTNVTDVGDYANELTGEPRGLVSPLVFSVGVNGEFLIDSRALLAEVPEPSTAAVVLLPVLLGRLVRRRGDRRVSTTA
ncbi:MAG: hypothetical protein AAGL98_09220, partial [Planctomycetota bacterium]